MKKSPLLNKVLSVLILLSFVLIPTASYAEGGGKHGGKMFQKLNLTEEQQAQFKELREQSKETFEAKKEAVKSAKEKLTAAATTGATNAQLTTLFKEFQKARSDMSLYRFEQKLKMKALLTDEQKENFKLIRDKHKGKRGQHKQKTQES